MTAEFEQTKSGLEGGSEQRSAPVPKHVANALIGGTSALGAGIIIERGFGFLANLLAARLGGAATFGAYSLGITTANNISAYAAGGIGSTAIRFSGKYPRDSVGYATLSRVLLIVSLVSAAIAALGLCAGAGPIANLLGKTGLKTLLQWAALSAAGMILLECCRGFLVGQRRFAAILLLSSAVGVGMISLLPVASRVSPVRMIMIQGFITIGAVLLCLLFYKPLGLGSTALASAGEPLGPMLRSVWSFGLMQLAGLVGMNAAGWWLTSLVARSDTSLVQMGFFAIAHQLRNVVALAPSLLTESGLAVMAQSEEPRENEHPGTPNHVMAACTFATVFASLFLAGLGIIFVPWGLTLLYGKSYAAASAATAIALATAVIHMGSAPAQARLSIVSIRLSGVINTFWALFVALTATVCFLGAPTFLGTGAWQGALIYLAAHLLSAALVFSVLSRRGFVPAGMKGTFLLGSAAVILLTALAFLRDFQPALVWPISLLMLASLLLALAAILRIGKRHRWVPGAAALASLLRSKGLLPKLAFSTAATTGSANTPSGGFDA